MLFTLFAFVVALGSLITFHELGHYWVARRCGVRVLRFSVGFGRVLAKRVDRHGTEWALSAIPLGGYVKMLDEPRQPDGADAHEAFNRQSVGRRFAIVAAGPIANLVLAAILYTCLNLVGSQEPAAILAAPPPETPAAMAGFNAGDQIVSIDGHAVNSWGEVRWNLLDALTSGGSVFIQTESKHGSASEHTLTLAAGSIEPDSGDLLAQAGLMLAAPRPRVEQVVAGGSGEKAGLRDEDIIIAVDGLAQPTASQFIKHIQTHPDQIVAITVLRNETRMSLQVVPAAELDENDTRVGRIGVMLGADYPMVTVRYGLIQSLWRGTERTIDTVWFSLKMMGRMVTGEISARNISGPVTIADYAGKTARLGLAAYIAFVALISVSIGILNLLPIPMLDGGHLMYYLIEILRGKPLSEQWLENGQRIGLVFLAALMGLAFFNDFARLFS